MKHKTILILLTILLSLTANAIPARKGIIPLMQPDGTTFSAVFRGDENVRIKTTTDGCAIIQDEEGWWCYARYDAEGHRYSSGWRIGQEAPGNVVAESRNIGLRIARGEYVGFSDHDDYRSNTTMYESLYLSA